MSLEYRKCIVLAGYMAQKTMVSYMLTSSRELSVSPCTRRVSLNWYLNETSTHIENLRMRKALLMIGVIRRVRSAVLSALEKPEME